MGLGILAIAAWWALSRNGGGDIIVAALSIWMGIHFYA